MKRIVLACFSLICLPFLAHAQIMVIGSGLGKDCFKAAKTYPDIRGNAERICSDAIKSGTLTERDLTASYVNRGIIRMRVSKFDGAYADYAAARKLSPKNGIIYLNEGAALIRDRRPYDAIAALKKSLGLKTKDAHIAYYNLGLAYDMTEQLNEAYFAFQEALKLKPDWPLALEQLDRYIVSEG